MMVAGFKCVSFVKEEHGQPLFGVHFNPYITSEQIFATVGSNRVTVYRCNEDKTITARQAYCDTDAEENFYTCVWSYDDVSGEGLLGVAGLKGVIRVIGTSKMECRTSFSAHGNAVNELKTHPHDPNLMLSASKDHALRLWNIKSAVCIAIFGGVEGHRDEVLSVDFNLSGQLIVSSGMDHALKVWDLESSDLQRVISLSYQHQRGSDVGFPTLLVHFPSHSSRKIHRNYVDCVRWFGNLVLSKSCENSVALWAPPPDSISSDVPPTTPNIASSDVLHRFEVGLCEIWYMRFCLDQQLQLMALGNQVGRVYIWDMMDVNKFTRPLILAHPRCQAAIRQVSFSKNSRTLISVCDSGTVWRWDKKDS